MFYRAEAYTIAKRNSPPVSAAPAPLLRRRFAAGVWALSLAAAALMFLPAVSISAPPLRLPADEDGLAELLSSRELDTVQYEQLLAFYALPLSVPQGELGYLALVFPDFAEMFPATFEELSEYQPFDNRQIRRLFNDYPALEGFEPILRFNDAAAPAESNGEVVVGINRSSVTALRGYRMRFRRKGAALSAEGALALSDSAALWQSRRLDASYKGVSAHVGNFRQPIPGELAFGYFAPISSLTELMDGKMGAAANWLYGGSGAWNGASVDAGEIWGAKGFGVGARAFCHLRPAESGCGAGADVNVGKRVRVFAGFTAFRLGVAADGGVGDDVESGGKDVVANEYYYAHLFAEYKAKGVSAAAEAAAPLAAERALPALSLRLNYRAKGTSAEYHTILYPEGGAFPISRLKRQLLAEAGEKAPEPPVQKHALRMSVPFICDAVKLTPEIDFVSSGGVKRIHGQAQALARVGGASVAVKHAAKFFAAGADSASHTTSASINCPTAYPVSLRASFQSAYGRGRTPRHSYTVEAPTEAVPSAVITPYIRGKYASANEFWPGVKSEFHLYKKTWTGVTLEIPVNVKGADNVYFKVSSSYSF